MWTKSGRKRLVPTVKHTPKINVWAAFSSMWTFPLSIFNHNMNSDMFLWILQTHLISQAFVFHENAWRVVMDNDPKHKSKVVKKFLDKMSRIRSLAFPKPGPQSDWESFRVVKERVAENWS